MELQQKMNSVLERHGIDRERELIIRSKNGSLYYIPLYRLIEIVSNLYKSQKEIIEQKLQEVESNANKLMDFLYYLAKPLAKIRI